MRQTYTFLDDDRVVVTRPQAAREISAVKALRTGHWSPGANFEYYVPEVMEKMIKTGWIRSEARFSTFKREVWEDNRDAVRRILNGRE